LELTRALPGRPKISTQTSGGPGMKFCPMVAPMRAQNHHRFMSARWKFRLLLVAMLTWVAAMSTERDLAHADDYPSRPIHLIVPYAAGGAADSIARVIAKRVGTALGDTMLVENRGGGAAITGTEFVNNSAPDGYMLLL